MKMEYVTRFWGTVLLLWGSVQDIRSRSVAGYYLLTAYLGSIAILLLGIFRNPQMRPEHLAGHLLCGILSAAITGLLCKITRGRIGLGDAGVIGVMGILYGLKGMLCLVFTALMGAMLVAMLLLLGKKADLKTPLPFLPFLLLAQVMQLLT